ncbi:MAG: BLUF domain-containing protein [Bacteroidota bacterium]
MADIFSIVYASSANKELDETELQEILNEARCNNKASGISGLLLYANGNFLQILEGSEASVMNLVHRIEQDNRHHGIIRLMEFRSSERSFPEWSMGYRQLSAGEMEGALPGYINIFKSQAIADEIQAKVKQSVWTLLMSFRQIVNV